MKSTGKSSKLGTIVLYVVAAIVLLAGIAALWNNIKSYLDMVDYYVAQGYTASMVHQQLLASSLLPGIFEPIVYCGVGATLFGIAAIFKKVSLLSAAIVGTPAVESASAEVEGMDDEAE